MRRQTKRRGIGEKKDEIAWGYLDRGARFFGFSFSFLTGSGFSLACFAPSHYCALVLLSLLLDAQGNAGCLGKGLVDAAVLHGRAFEVP